MTNQGLHIFTWLNTRVFLHPTFLFIPMFFILPDFLRGNTENALLHCRLFLMIYIMVTLHEYGHILMARARGIETGDISLNMLGGIAYIKIDNSNDINNRDEILVALAGPAVNLVFLLVTIIFLVIFMMAGFSNLPDMGFPIEFLVINIVLLSFNMLPIFPLDGGRVLRGCLGGLLGRRRGTVIVIFIGLIGSICVSVLAIIFEIYIFLLPMIFVVFLCFYELRNLPEEDNKAKHMGHVGKAGP